MRGMITLTVMLMLAPIGAQARNCFQPLSDPKSTNTKHWNDLRLHKAETSNAEVTQVQTIETGKGSKINMDYYGVTFKKSSTRSIEEVFTRLRRSFPVYAKGQSGGPSAVKDSAVNFFGPYRKPRDLSVATMNQKMWESADPSGAIMSFVLDSFPPAFIFTATSVQPVVEQGDVLVTCSSSRDFIFSTVKTKEDGWHPVNGNRGFGIKDNGDGTWTFYTMGVDRTSKSFSVSMAESFLAKFIPHIPSEVEAEERMFYLGDKFWIKFFGAIEDDLNRQGMTVQSFSRNSERYPYSSNTPNETAEGPILHKP